MQLLPPSELYLESQPHMTQLTEWTKGPEESETKEGPVLPSWGGTGGRQLDPAADAWRKSSSAGRV